MNIHFLQKVRVVLCHSERPIPHVFHIDLMFQAQEDQILPPDTQICVTGCHDLRIKRYLVSYGALARRGEIVRLDHQRNVRAPADAVMHGTTDLVAILHDHGSEDGSGHIIIRCDQGETLDLLKRCVMARSGYDWSSDVAAFLQQRYIWDKFNISVCFGLLSPTANEKLTEFAKKVLYPEQE